MSSYPLFENLQLSLQKHNLFYLITQRSFTISFKVKRSSFNNQNLIEITLFRIYILIITIITNGMINTTFASLKNNRQVLLTQSKNNQHKKIDAIPLSFKEIRQMKQGSQIKNISCNSNKKALENQQNTFYNAIHDQQYTNIVRKNLIKLDKSKKKMNHTHAFKSPSHKISQITPNSNKDKQIQLSTYRLRGTPHKNEENPYTFTPSIIKNHSFTREQSFINHSNMTKKQIYTENSEKSSLSISSKASFDENYTPCQKDTSYEQDDKGLRDNPDRVISSIQLYKQNPVPQRVINDFNKYDSQIKNMKKSTHFYCSNVATEGNQKDIQQKSITSSMSSNVGSSFNFTQKFKHFKRHQTQISTQLKKSKQLSLNQFTLGIQIGSGKYGKVYLARHKTSGFICAIKSVSKKMIKDENLQIPFIRQIKIQMYLNHPNIVRLYGFFHNNDNIYLIMEYCSGSHLFRMIRQKNAFDQEEVIEILGNVFEAVSYLHCHGVIHRDLKPQNIVIENGVYKICDFGWAAYACGDSRTTFCGTPLYVCPQVLKGQQYNSKADIWGLGIITYELTYGRVPFSIMNQSDLMKIIKDPVYFPIWGNSNSKLIKFIKLMLSKDPDERPSLNQILSSDIFQSFSEKNNSPYRSELNNLW